MWWPWPALHVMICYPHMHSGQGSPHYFKLSFVHPIPVLSMFSGRQTLKPVMLHYGPMEVTLVWHPARGTAYLISPPGHSFCFKTCRRDNFCVVHKTKIFNIFLLKNLVNENLKLNRLHLKNT